MNQKITAKTLDLIRQAVSLEDLVGSYLVLKEGGKSFAGRCPFHLERTPSFHVYPATQTFKCFGCNQFGDVFSFYMEIEKVSFPEAVQKLAEIGNLTDIALPIALPFDSLNRPGNTPASKISRHQVASILEELGRYFETALFQPDGEMARQYLFSRGVSFESVKNFKIGYAPKNRILFQYLKEKKWTDQELMATGLFYQRGQSDLYCLLQDRIVFPITDMFGKIISFGGRLLDIMTESDLNQKQPKYINGNETLLFKKSLGWYGVAQAKKAIQDSELVYLVEGYLDVVLAHQSRVANVVASLGTSVSDEQLIQLGRLMENPRFVLMFDGDLAGEKAAWRVLEKLLKFEFDVSFIVFQDNHDPASFIKTFGETEFYSQVTFLQKWYEVLFHKLATKYGTETAEQKNTIFNWFFRLIKTSPSYLIQSEVLHYIGKKLNLQDYIVNHILQSKLSHQIPKKNQPGTHASFVSKVKTDQTKNEVGRSKLLYEKHCLAILIACPDFAYVLNDFWEAEFLDWLELSTLFFSFVYCIEIAADISYENLLEFCSRYEKTYPLGASGNEKIKDVDSDQSPDRNLLLEETLVQVFQLPFLDSTFVPDCLRLTSYLKKLQYYWYRDQINLLSQQIDNMITSAFEDPRLPLLIELRLDFLKKINTLNNHKSSYSIQDTIRG